MGWMHTYKPSSQTMAEFFHAQGVTRWSVPEGTPRTYRVLDTSTVHRKVFYAAVERVDSTDPDNPKRDVFALIILLRWTTGEYNVLYKDMDETMGPYESTCPERLLDLLTPTNNENANAWRMRCREYHAKRRAAKDLQPGDLVKYSGSTYLLVTPIERRGWEVRHTTSGNVYRMKPSQLEKAKLVTQEAA